MSFNSGLSGMRAASKELNVTGNNIANAGTIGFKQSRAEFSNVFAASMGVGGNPVGSGVQLANISQQFSQGNVNFTGNALDMAINGKGFFQVSNNGAMSYTRAGYFGTDRDGFVVDNAGFRLQGYTVGLDGQLSDSMGDLQILSASQQPKSTSKIDQVFNLNSTNSTPAAWKEAYNSAALNELRGSATNLTAGQLPSFADATEAAAWHDGLLASNPAASTYDAKLKQSYEAIVLDPAFPTDPAERLAAINAAIVEAGAQADSAILSDSAAMESVRSVALSQANAAFNSTDPSSYNSSTSTNIYDSQGNAHVMTQYFVKTGANEWRMNVLIDGRNPADPSSTDPYKMNVSFDASGRFSSITDPGASDPAYDPASALFTVENGKVTLKSASQTSGGWVPAMFDATTNAGTGGWVANGAAGNAEGVSMEFTRSTQYSSAFAVNAVSQDGYTTGELAGLEVDETGQIFARYTNGQSKVQGRVVLASFANEQGLTPVGKGQWVQSFESGEALMNAPGVGTMGALQSGALEDSNVELSDQLVNLIIAQRNYQASAKSIETESAVTQAIINLR